MAEKLHIKDNPKISGLAVIMTVGHSWYASTFPNGYQWLVPLNPPIESGVPPICKVGITDQKWQDPCAVHLRFTSHSPKYPIMSTGEKEFIWFG
jgi:hypothetical protein